MAVSLEGGDDDLFETVTGADGRYRFLHVKPGGYAYAALIPGYSVRSNYMASGGSGVPFQVPARGLTLDIAMVPQGRVRGRVLDIQGRPAAGARVRVFAADGGSASDGDTRTDSLGRFEVRELDVLYPRPASLYQVETFSPQLSVASKQVRVVPIYKQDDAAVVTLTLRPRAIISGRLTMRGRTLANALVSLDGPALDEEPQSAATTKDGRYSLSVSAPATYLMRLDGDDAVQQEVRVRVLPGRNSVLNRELKPFPYGSIRGRVVNLSGVPMAGAYIELWNRDSSEESAVATTNKNGRFFVPKVVPRDDYAVVALLKDADQGRFRLPGVRVRSYHTTKVVVRGDSIAPLLQMIAPPRVLHGLVELRFMASDNQGLQYARAELDRRSLDDGKQLLSMEFDRKQPPHRSSGMFKWNSRRASNGRHRLRVEVSDLAGNTSAREWIVWIRNSPGFKPPTPTSTPATGLGF